MSALFYSSNAQVYSRLRSQFEATLPTVVDVDLGGVTVGLAHTEALGKDDQVLITADGGVLCAGLMLYQEESGARALADFYRDFTRGGIQGTLSGSFSAAVVHGRRLSWITDPAGVSELYVHSGPHGLSCATSLFFLASVIPGLSLHELALLEKAFQYSTLGSDTIFKEIQKVSALATVSMGLEDLVPNRPGPPIRVATLETIEPAIDSSPAGLVDTLVNEFARLDKVCAGFDISMTGGLDSRLQLAVMLAAGIAPSRIRLLHGVGSSLVTNTKAQDKVIVGEVGARFGLEVVYADWSDADLSPQQWQRLLGIAGEAGLVYGANHRIVQRYVADARCGRFQVFGYFGELLRPLDWQVSSGFADVDIEQFLDFYLYSNFKGFGAERRREFRCWMHDKIQQRLGAGRIGPEAVQDLYLAYRQSADTVMSRLCSMFGLSHPVMGSQRFLQALSRVPVERKIGSALMIDMIACAAPELLEVGIFSHGAVYHYDRARRRLHYPESSLQRIRRYLSVGLHRFPRLRHVIRTQYLRAFAAALGRSGDMDVESRVKALAVAAQKDSGLGGLNLERFAGNHAALIGFAQYVALFGWAQASAVQAREETF